MTLLASYIRYVVRKGDARPKIAACPEMYGDADQCIHIYDANQDIIGRDRTANMARS